MGPAAQHVRSGASRRVGAAPTWQYVTSAAGGGTAADLDRVVLERALPGRPVRSYPALLSTDADAQAWARAGADAGAVVVADYQASPRGRGGLSWTTQPGVGLGFSMVLRPPLPSAREGWLYVLVGRALLDVLPPSASVSWPDEVHSAERPLARFGILAEPGLREVRWAVATVLIEEVTPPRAPLLARVVAAIEGRLGQEPAAILAEYQPRCVTLGQHLRARMIPLGPAGTVVTGQAIDVLSDGSLILHTERGHRVAIRPQNLGLLEGT
jgi:BirA family biotin operon repressor/biotin-[acetyl-CoA-carboxylase] ligase